MPDVLVTTLSIVAKIVPAVGFAMLLKYTITAGRGWMITFFIMGFLLVKNTSFNIVSLTLFAVGLAAMYIMARYGRELSGKEEPVAAVAAPVEDEDGEYDE